MGAARQLGRGEAGGVSCRPFSFNNLRWVYLAKSLAFNILDRFTAQGVTKLVESVACGQANTACLSLESFQVRERERERERDNRGAGNGRVARVELLCLRSSLSKISRRSSDSSRSLRLSSGSSNRLLDTCYQPRASSGDERIGFSTTVRILSAARED
jgi:hypothetical protein